MDEIHRLMHGKSFLPSAFSEKNNDTNIPNSSYKTSISQYDKSHSHKNNLIDETQTHFKIWLLKRN
jgi:hypothetical protein